MKSHTITHNIPDPPNGVGWSSVFADTALEVAADVMKSRPEAEMNDWTLGLTVTPDMTIDPGADMQSAYTLQKLRSIAKSFFGGEDDDESLALETLEPVMTNAGDVNYIALTAYSLNGMEPPYEDPDGDRVGLWHLGQDAVAALDSRTDMPSGIAGRIRIVGPQTYNEEDATRGAAAMTGVCDDGSYPTGKCIAFIVDEDGQIGPLTRDEIRVLAFAVYGAVDALGKGVLTAFLHSMAVLRGSVPGTTVVSSERDDVNVKVLDEDTVLVSSIRSV